MTSDRPRIQTDFNDLADGRATALVGIGGAARVPATGELVELFDPDGNTCLARVDEIENSVLYMAPLWDTWQDGGYVSDLMTALAASVEAARSARTDPQNVESKANPVKFKQYA